MKKRLLMGVIGLSLLLVGSAAFAGKYGMAGCGLGARVFEGQNDWVSQVLASTTNGTSGNQTFGITSGTSECTTDGVVRSEKVQQAFAEANFDSLAQEMAQGRGEHLRAFAYLLGCSEQSLPVFGRMTQQHYTRIFNGHSTTPLDVINAVKQGITEDTSLARDCQG